VGKGVTRGVTSKGYSGGGEADIVTEGVVFGVIDRVYFGAGETKVSVEMVGCVIEGLGEHPPSPTATIIR